MFLDTIVSFLDTLKCYIHTMEYECCNHIVLLYKFQDGAAMFGRRPGRSAKTVFLFTFLLTFDFSFYTHNVCTDHLRQRYTLGHWKPLH